MYEKLANDVKIETNYESVKNVDKKAKSKQNIHKLRLYVKIYYLESKKT